MKPKDCNDGNLAEAVFEFAREAHELHLELKRSNNNKAVLNRIAEMENKIMSAIQGSTEDECLLLNVLEKSKVVTVKLERVAIALGRLDADNP